MTTLLTKCRESVRKGLTPAQLDVEHRIDDAIAKAAGYLPDPSPQAAAIRAEPVGPTKPT